MLSGNVVLNPSARPSAFWNAATSIMPGAPSTCTAYSAVIQLAGVAGRAGQADHRFGALVDRIDEVLVDREADRAARPGSTRSAWLGMKPKRVRYAGSGNQAAAEWRQARLLERHEPVGRHQPGALRRVMELMPLLVGPVLIELHHLAGALDTRAAPPGIHRASSSGMAPPAASDDHDDQQDDVLLLHGSSVQRLGLLFATTRWRTI